MSFVGNLGSLSPEFLAYLASTAPDTSGRPRPKLTDRKPDSVGPSKDDDGISPIAAVVAFELLSASADSPSEPSFSGGGGDFGGGGASGSFSGND